MMWSNIHLGPEATLTFMHMACFKRMANMILESLNKRLIINGYFRHCNQ